MKNPNQIRENSKRAAGAAQPQAPRRVVRINFTVEEKTVIRAAAKALGLTLPQFLERAIERQLSIVERALTEESVATAISNANADQLKALDAMMSVFSRNNARKVGAK